MLKKKPYFTYLLEVKGALYQAKINGIVVESDFDGDALNYEQPVNQYMRTGKNRVGFAIYTTEPEAFDDAKITVSLFVNQDEAPESQKRLISQVTFKASDFDTNENAEKAIQASMPAVRLDSTNDFKQDKNGDVIVSSPTIKPSEFLPHSFEVYQDIKLETPFPLWGFFNADKLDFPDAEKVLLDNYDKYEEKLMGPLYKEHERILEILKTRDYKQILPLFEERNKEMNIALYYPEGTYQEKLKKALEGDFENKDSKLILKDFEWANPTVSDNKDLIRIGSPQMIHFVDEENSFYSKYPIWFYKKDGKWIISR